MSELHSFAHPPRGGPFPPRASPLPRAGLEPPKPSGWWRSPPPHHPFHHPLRLPPLDDLVVPVAPIFRSEKILFFIMIFYFSFFILVFYLVLFFSLRAARCNLPPPHPVVPFSPAPCRDEAVTAPACWGWWATGTSPPTRRRRYVCTPTHPETTVLSDSLVSSQVHSLTPPTQI